MLNIFRITAKLSTISSCFGFTSRLSVFICNHSTLKILSLGIHTSNQGTFRRPYPYYVFEDIASLDEAETLFDQMLRIKPMSPILDFNKLMNIVVKMENYSEVIVMFKRFSLLGCLCNDYTMNIVVNCYCKLKEVELGFAVVASFIKRGYAPDIVTFSCMIKGFFLKGKVSEAIGLFNKLVRDELIEVNDITISTVLDGLSKSGHVDKAVKLIELSEKRNWKLNVAAYSTVIDGLCKRGMVKEGMALLFNMIDRDVLPNIVTYNSLLHGLCDLNKFDLASSIFDDLPSKGIIPDVITYTVMIHGLCGEGLFQAAKEMLEEMERIGCLPNRITYNVITRGCLKHHDSCYSIDLLRLIIGRDFQLDALTFFQLLRKMKVLRQMKDIYDDDFINDLMRKLIFSHAIHLDSNDEFLIRSLIQKLNFQ